MVPCLGLGSFCRTFLGAQIGDGGEVKEVKVQLGPRKNAKVSGIFRVGVGLIVDFDGVF